MNPLGQRRDRTFKIGVLQKDNPDVLQAVKLAIEDAYSNWITPHLRSEIAEDLARAALAAVFKSIKEPMTPTETDEALKAKTK